MAPSMNMPELRRALDAINALTDDAWIDVVALVSVRTVAPGEHLLRAGEIARRVFFVKRGLLREYYLDDAGRESTRRFCDEGEFSGSLVDLLVGAAAKSATAAGAAVSIESLGDSELLELDWAALDALAERHPSLMKLLRRFAEGLYVRKMMREFDMLTLPAAERYRRFAEEYPALEARLPRNMVASYLGITPVHLSRICGGGTRTPAPGKPARKT